MWVCVCSWRLPVYEAQTNKRVPLSAPMLLTLFHSFCWFVTLILTLRSIVLLFSLHCEVWDECFVWESVSSVMVSVVKREDEAVRQNNKIHLGDLQLQKVTDSRSCYCWVNVIITHSCFYFHSIFKEKNGKSHWNQQNANIFFSFECMLCFGSYINNNNKKKACLNSLISSQGFCLFLKTSFSF